MHQNRHEQNEAQCRGPPSSGRVPIFSFVQRIFQVERTKDETFFTGQWPTT